jgi:hypothetical protein
MIGAPPPGGLFAPLPILQKKILTLLPHQVDHFDRIVGILSRNYGYIDVSSMGRGKTYVLSMIALYFNIPFFVICPIADPWDQVDREFDLKGLYQGSLTYGKIAGVKGSELKHQFLHKIDSETGRASEYTPTAAWIAACRSERGVLLVLDEVHSIKNRTSSRSRAMRSLVRSLVEIGGNSRFAFLSATYFDQIPHARAFVMAMGFVKSDEMIKPNPGTRVPEFTGIAELVQVCLKMDKELAEEIVHRYESVGINGKNVDKLTYDLYVEIIHPAMGSEMPDNLPKRNFRGFFKITRENDRITFLKAVQGMKDAAQYNEATGLIGKVDLEKVRQAIMDLGDSVVFDMCRVQIKFLRANSNGKVVFYMNNLEPVESVRNIMTQAGYRCNVITGESVKSGAERLRIKEDFLSNPDINVLVMTVAVGAQSLNLHIQKPIQVAVPGGSTMVTFVVNALCTPSYFLGLMHQASGRSNRTNQLTIPTFMVFYPFEPLTGIMEKILIRLAEKSKTLMTTRIASQDPSEMPGGYPRFFEGYGFVDERAIVGRPFAESDELMVMKMIKGDVADIPFMTLTTPSLSEISGIAEDKLPQHIADLYHINLIDVPDTIVRIREASMINFPLARKELPTSPGPIIGMPQSPSMFQLPQQPPPLTLGGFGLPPPPQLMFNTVAPSSPSLGLQLPGPPTPSLFGAPPQPMFTTIAPPPLNLGLSLPQQGSLPLPGNTAALVNIFDQPTLTAVPPAGGMFPLPLPRTGTLNLPQPGNLTGIPPQFGMRM